MVTIRYVEGRGWHDARVEARAPISLDPAAAVLHYAQEIFEGLKAYRTADGGAALFRPEANALRFRRSAERLAMPPLPDAVFVESVKQLVSADRDWIPSSEGGSLYLRPFMIASEVFLGVKPSSEYLYLVIASAVGAYFKGGSETVTVWVSQDQTRAAPGGTGAAKCGGNYAASLRAQAAAVEHGCAQVVFLDAIERRWVEELDPDTGEGGRHRGRRAALFHRRLEGGRRQRTPARGLRLRHRRGDHPGRDRAQPGRGILGLGQRRRPGDEAPALGPRGHPARQRPRSPRLGHAGLLSRRRWFGHSGTHGNRRIDNPWFRRGSPIRPGRVIAYRPTTSFRGAAGEPGIQIRRQRQTLLDLRVWILGSAARPQDDGVPTRAMTSSKPPSAFARPS
jgi:hypothetical protein